ncbi:MAG: DUF58 domain-containing protein [Sulfitobacter sp.]
MKAALDTPGVALGAQELIALRRVALNAAGAPQLTALPGGFATRRKGHGLEVADTREYQPGDDIRHVDRGTTARTGRLHVRQFQEERDQVTLLVADFRPEMFWGLRRAFRSVACAEALSLIGWNVVERGGRVALLALTASGPVIAPPRGRARGMLDAIGAMVQAHDEALEKAMQGQTETPPLDAALARAERLVPSGAEVIIASGFDTLGADLGDRLSSLARRRTPRLVLITDAEAGQMPKGRYPILLPDGRRIRVYLGGDAAKDTAPTRPIAGREALVLDAGETVDRMALRLAAAYQLDWAA